MRVSIGSILEVRGGTIQFQGQQEIFISDCGLDLKLAEPVAVNGTITNIGKGFLVQADLSFKYTVDCGRCLENFAGTGRVLVQEQFVSQNALHENSDLSDDNFFKFTGDVIDLRECIQEQVFLALPMSFVCRLDCKGLCASCGRNLNQEICNCSRETINPQFAKLKVLLTDKEAKNKNRVHRLKGGGTDGEPQE